MATYKGYQIQLRDDLSLQVKGVTKETQSDISGLFGTPDEAKKAIDAFLSSKKKQAQSKLSLPVIAYGKGGSYRTHVLKSTQINGIHTGHGTILLSDKTIDKDDVQEYYPDLPWVKTTLERIDALNREVNALDNALKAFAIISRPWGYGRITDIATAVKQITDEVNRKTNAANATTLDQELEKRKEKKNV